MTKSQEKALKKIRKLVEEEFYSDRCEIKEWTVKENEYFVSLVVEYGLKNDEGTMAEVYARDRAHLFIGKRGGITYPVNKKNGDMVCRRFKGYSILQAVCDQRHIQKY